MESIYDRYGDQPFWESLLDRFYERNLHDQRLRSYFEGKDITRVKAMNRGLLEAALRPGGDHFPVSVKRVHKDMSITTGQFDAFVENFSTTIAESGVTKEDLDEILSVVGSFREDVVKV